MDKKEILIESAKYIAEYCGEHDVCNESCAFFRGWNKLFGEPGTQMVICALNLGETPPCEWDI